MQWLKPVAVGLCASMFVLIAIGTQLPQRSHATPHVQIHKPSFAHWTEGYRYARMREYQWDFSANDLRASYALYDDWAATPSNASEVPSYRCHQWLILQELSRRGE
jgi:hypothetical protein